MDPTVESIDPTLELRLNRMDITFSSKGGTWNLYDGSIPRNQITWTSNNPSVASIADGVVVAVGGGDTVVFAQYGDQKVSCIIRCAFKDNTGIAGNGGVSEDGGGSEKPAAFPFTGTITVDGVNIRRGPGLSYEKVGLKAINEQVTLYEKSNALGGVFIAAAAPSFKEKDRALIAWYRRDIAKYPSIEVKLNAEVKSISDVTAV